MPHINVIKCPSCKLAFPPGWGSYVYALDEDGRRIVCGHPGEFSQAERITGMKWSEAEGAGRVGSARFCMCFACLHQFDLDLDREIKRCPKCLSLEVRSARGALGCDCPRCGKARFVEESTGLIC